MSKEREYVTICTYCGNETSDTYCHKCNEYDGLVEGYYVGRVFHEKKEGKK